MLILKNLLIFSRPCGVSGFVSVFMFHSYVQMSFKKKKREKNEIEKNWVSECKMITDNLLQNTLHITKLYLLLETVKNCMCSGGRNIRFTVAPLLRILFSKFRCSVSKDSVFEKLKRYHYFLKFKHVINTFLKLF